MSFFADLGDLDEDERITQIGYAVAVHKMTVAFIVDAVPGKADRYMRKLRERFPDRIRELGRMPGPVANTITVKVGPALT